MNYVLTSNGTVSWRGPARVLSIALCLAGFVQFATGAIVPAKAMVAQLLLERAFDRSVATHRSQKPWPWADMAPIARISVPRLGVDSIVLDTGSGQAMAFGPTLLPGGARLGAPGTAVIAAHRDTHFRFLEHVRTGDLIAVKSLDGTTQRYRVNGAEIVRWDKFAVDTEGAAAQLALSTCYPFGALDHGPLRYVVHASQIEKR
ncbi:class GN sortase [Sphingomonas paeninsulae]|jgi:sortase A|uniref:Class GN sortase n=1 Tax=Sphingomonas paeninsulae TaxID=2319844 RepID=A0A494TP88_SPHPE|nr:class GN sortase [Sphingomonas paeninsulae]AYJ86885.1 class GN sortase [Sphingomonas paeninsulae]